MLLPIGCYICTKMEAVRFSEIFEIFPMLQHIQMIVQRVKQEENMKHVRQWARCVVCMEVKHERSQLEIQIEGSTNDIFRVHNEYDMAEKYL
jgi:hypothetical protein